MAVHAVRLAMKLHLILINWCILFGWSLSSIVNASEVCSNGTCEEPDTRIKLSQSCVPGRLYCGELLGVQLFYPKVKQRHYLENSLGQCKNDGSETNIVDFCPWGCTSQQNANAFCKCQANKLICGHELLDMLYMNGTYDRGTLYLCSEDGTNTTEYSTCPHGICKMGICPCEPDRLYCSHEMRLMSYFPKYNNSIYQCFNWTYIIPIAFCDSCSRQTNGIYCTCIPGKRYCGLTLYYMGWRGYENNTVYLCETSKYVKKMVTCNGECDRHYSMCKCVQNMNYCGLEVTEKLGWPVEVDNYQKLYQCTEEEQLEFVVDCGRCNTTHKQYACTCIPGKTYCGSLLNKMSSIGYQNNTLYRCADGINVKEQTVCPGECQSYACDCIPGRKYCGPELYNLGWQLRENDRNLYLCTTELNVYHLAYCSKCYSKQGKPYCECQSPFNYCGHVLDGSGELFKNDTVYSCYYESFKDAPRASQVCAKSCIQQSRHSATCTGECAPNRTYCGNVLKEMGFRDLNNNTVYICSEDGLNVSSTGKIEASCNDECAPGYYCAEELYQLPTELVVQMQNALSPHGLSQLLLQCSFERHVSMFVVCGSGCVHQAPNSYCQCRPGYKYCGKWLTMAGHSGYNSSLLYQCQNDHSFVHVETCNTGCEGNDYTGHCLCEPGQKYCGHELHLLYNHDGKRLDVKTVYLCPHNQSLLIPLETCRDECTSGPARCQQKCIFNQHYCGSGLLQLDGWTHETLEPNMLYQCTNGTNAQFMQNCTAGCASMQDGDSYCKGPPLAWYWLLMAITLPFLFIFLVFMLIQQFLKRRRLSKFLQQRRIDASQLTLQEVLGQGAFGEVWHGKYKPDNKLVIDVALKISKHHNHSSQEKRRMVSAGELRMGLATANAFVQETVALEFLRHRNITVAFGICSNFKGSDEKTTPVLVLEFMNGGSAVHYALEERNHLTQRDLIKIFIDMCSACKHLCKMGVVHRDIGARNVLIRKHPDTGKPIIAKLTDFGLARDIGKGIDGYKAADPERIVIPIRYTAPEGFKGIFSSKSDVWSFGVFMWEIYTLMEEIPPIPYYSIASDEDVKSSVMNGQKLLRPSLAPDDMHKIMDSCWSLTPESRPSFDQLCKLLQSVKTNVPLVGNRNNDDAPIAGPSNAMDDNSMASNYGLAATTGKHNNVDNNVPDDPLYQLKTKRSSSPEPSHRLLDDSHQVSRSRFGFKGYKNVVTAEPCKDSSEDQKADSAV